jgi:hypothetical protein
MKHLKNTLVFILLLAAAGDKGLYALDPADVKVELQFYQQTYHLNDPIPVTIQVENISAGPVSFQVSPLIFETFFFNIRTPRSEAVPLLDTFEAQMKNNASSSGDFRDIVLQPQESFSRVIDITQWFDFKESGYYFIQGLFRANPDKKADSLSSIDYKILVKPPLLVEKKLSEDEKERNTRIEEVKKLPPYDVISDLLDAKMKKDWERFLVHIDAERLISAFQDYNNDYQNARSGKYRLEILEDFKRYLTRHWQDRIEQYTIGASQIQDEKATVVCDVDFATKTLQYGLRYTFSLYMNHLGQWLVYDYSVLKIK